MISVRLLKPGRGLPWKGLAELVGADPASVPRLEKRDRIALLHLTGLRAPAASILKQCMLSGGADALVHREVITCRIRCSDALVYGTPSTILRGCLSLDGQPFGLGPVADTIRNVLEPAALPEELLLGGRSFRYGDKPLIMGIINATPDSFSDGGRYGSAEQAADAAIEMGNDGASMVDVGGESTRPGSAAVPEAVQIQRTIPVIRAIGKLSDLPVSIDTALPGVARAAVKAGAGMINSVNGLETPGMAETAAELAVPVCVMHMRGIPESMQDDPSYGDVVQEVTDYLLQRVEHLAEKGIERKKILVDPGIGFGKTLHHNLALLRSLERIRRETGCRLLLGHSRKSFLGMITGVDDPSRRDALTHLVSAMVRGADVVRVHDVPGTANALKVAGLLEEGS